MTRDGLPRVLNLGCGEEHVGGALNVDVSPEVDPDEVVDLQETPWPWEDDAFSAVLAHHVLEHLDPVPWGEICRVLRPNGELDLRYPIGHTRFEDPAHEQFWNWNTAEALAGEREHGHEHVAQLSLKQRSLDWRVSGRACRAYTRLRLRLGGPGPWLSQVPGLYGEVHAIYGVTP